MVRKRGARGCTNTLRHAASARPANTGCAEVWRVGSQLVVTVPTVPFAVIARVTFCVGQGGQARQRSLQPTRRKRMKGSCISTPTVNQFAAFIYRIWACLWARTPAIGGSAETIKSLKEERLWPHMQEHCWHCCSMADASTRAHHGVGADDDGDAVVGEHRNVCGGHDRHDSCRREGNMSRIRACGRLGGMGRGWRGLKWAWGLARQALA